MAGEIIAIDFARKVKSEMRGLECDKSVCPENKKLIKLFIRDCYAEGLSHARVTKYINLMKQIARRMGKSFKQVEKDDIKALLEQVELSNYSAWTKRDFRIGIKRFWKWLYGTEQDPPIVSWIKTTLKEARRKQPSDMLTEEEILRLIQSADHPRDRALIAFFWESGCRVGELLTLRINSFKDNGEICFLDVVGKTGPRRIPIVASVPHLTKWLTFHPNKDNQDAPMWTNLNDRQFPKNLSYATFSNHLRRLAKKAGISKRIHPHLFRHSRATFLANHLTEAQMKQFFGWTQGSDMASTYVHLSGRDIQGSILAMYGKRPIEDKAKPKIVIAKCQRCGFDNSTDSRYCGRCGSPTSGSATISISHRMQIYDDLLSNLLSDKVVVKALDKRLRKDKDLTSKLKQLLEISEKG